MLRKSEKAGYTEMMEVGDGKNIPVRVPAWGRKKKSTEQDRGVLYPK